MTRINKWVDLSILGLCTVALSGLALRSKIVFHMPFINYNHLLEAHSHFTFEGWITLALLVCMVNEILPAHLNRRTAYQWLFGGITIIAWTLLISFLLGGYNIPSIIFFTIFIFLTYAFGWFFIKDILNSKLEKHISLLAISSIACLIISSSGHFIITYIFLKKSHDAILYRDALFTYLHFQYNGFFSLAIFALLFKHLGQTISSIAKKNIYRFTVVLCSSIIPSLFLSYLWKDPGPFFRIIAIGGSILVMMSFILFIFTVQALRPAYKAELPIIRFLIFLSLGSFTLKTLLQSFTIIPAIGNSIFGNRPIIMGFLHLVFLGFVSLFVMAFFVKRGFLDAANKFTRFALTIFALAVLFNEVILMAQGLATIFIPASTLFQWLLWVAAICLFSGALFIGIARLRTPDKQ